MAPPVLTIRHGGSLTAVHDRDFAAHWLLSLQDSKAGSGDGVNRIMTVEKKKAAAGTSDKTASYANDSDYSGNDQGDYYSDGNQPPWYYFRGKQSTRYDYYWL